MELEMTKITAETLTYVGYTCLFLLLSTKHF